MANTLLTPTQVLRKAGLVLHQKLNFTGTVSRQYDDQFAKSGAKIGDSLKIRLPNQFSVRRTWTLNAVDVAESSVTLQINTPYGVDMNFTDADLALSIDDFDQRFISPAMSVLAANIEADGLLLYKDIYQQSNNIGSAASFAKLMATRKLLVDAVAPNEDRSMCLNTQDNVDVVSELKGLFQKSDTISKQNTEGFLGRTAGFDFYENTLLTKHTSGTENGASTTITVNGANQTGAAITVTNGSSKTLKAGDIISFVGCNRVHPETKADTGVAQTFTVTADVATSGTSITISPSIVITGAKQNCSAAPTTAQAIGKHGGASAVYGISLAYQKAAFAFATADLTMPRGAHFAAREVMDGISMRIWQDGDITNSKFPCRIDVFGGWKTIRPELAARAANN